VRHKVIAMASVVAWCAASLAALSVSATPAGAVTAAITVDDAADGAAQASDCAPTPVAGSCSLRDAFAAAATGGADAGTDVVITIDPAITAITLTNGELLHDGGTGGAHPLTVQGSGAVVTQTTADRVVHSAGTGLFTLSGLTLTGGNTEGNGGAISSGGSVVVTDAALIGNQAGDTGGAIDVQHTVAVVRSTIANNTAGSFGGAVEGEQNDDAFVINSTIANNTAGAIGGALAGVGDVTLVYATITGNSAPQGANIGDNGGALTSFASVIAAPGGGGDNCRHLSATLSHGYNLEDDAAATCGFATTTHDLAPGTAPGLGALADNGGPGPTRLPAAGSALLDVVPLAACQGDILDPITLDERGVTRPQGTGCDVGAVEVVVPVTPVVPVPVAVQPAFTG